MDHTMEDIYPIDDEPSNEVYASILSNESDSSDQDGNSTGMMDLDRVDEEVLAELHEDDENLSQMDEEETDDEISTNMLRKVVSKPKASKKRGGKERKRDDYRMYTKHQVTKFIGFIIDQVPVKIAAYKAGITLSTAYRLRSQWESNQFITEKKPKGPKKADILNDDHAAYIVHLVDDFPAISLDQMREKTKAKFPGLKISKSAFYRFVRSECVLSIKKIEKHTEARSSDETIQKRIATVEAWLEDTEMDFSKNCVFLDEAGFNLHISRTRGWSRKGQKCVAEVPKSRGSNITIMGAITANEIIDIAIRKPVTVQCKKRRLENGSEVQVTGKIGTRKEHFKTYLGSVMDELDKKGLHGYYICMDNAPIHKPKDIQEFIESRGYKCIYLPPYSPFLNPIEEFWSKVKYLVKREPFDTKNTLTPRIKRACEMVTTSDLQGWVRHSMTFFERCLNGERKL